MSSPSRNGNGRFINGGPISPRRINGNGRPISPPRLNGAGRPISPPRLNGAGRPISPMPRMSGRILKPMPTLKLTRKVTKRYPDESGMGTGGWSNNGGRINGRPISPRRNGNGSRPASPPRIIDDISGSQRRNDNGMLSQRRNDNGMLSPRRNGNGAMSPRRNGNGSLSSLRNGALNGNRNGMMSSRTISQIRPE